MTLHTVLAKQSFIQQLFKFVTMLNKWYLRLVVKVPTVTTPSHSHDVIQALGSQLALTIVAGSHNHVITICSLSCQLPTSKINEDSCKLLSRPSGSCIL